MINDYKDLKIGKFQELQKIDWESMEEIDIQVAVIAILNDMTEDDVLSLPLTEYSKLASQTKFLENPPKPKKRLPSKITINGVEYVLLKDVSDMTTGQYIDYNQYLTSNDINTFLPHILSCFIIPKGKKYGDYNVDDVVNEIKENLSVEEALGISNFFMKKFRSSTRAILLYLDWKMKRMAKKTKDETMKKKTEEARKALHSLQNLIKDGGGFLP